MPILCSPRPSVSIAPLLMLFAVLNGLDNLEARRHVNRLCMAAQRPLIESGTAGYLGQCTVHLKGRTECFECTPKVAPKSFPICTLRNTCVDGLRSLGVSVSGGLWSLEASVPAGMSTHGHAWARMGDMHVEQSLLGSGPANGIVFISHPFRLPPLEICLLRVSMLPSGLTVPSTALSGPRTCSSRGCSGSRTQSQVRAAHPVCAVENVYCVRRWKRRWRYKSTLTYHPRFKSGLLFVFLGGPILWVKVLSPKRNPKYLSDVPQWLGGISREV